ncbi:mandelamide amidase [Paenarthrobacter nitroguajacolicus]|uniref:amidase family protein n=1 Tax=Paenarthrobacter nitroguajacolicus TaxID=211146 RepID=UPI00285B5609|nr:amidase family protein [Paenarthrobacter nitroguajacolicus]MDR6989272.1 mandelamide amidase [Paenarthrobacter nitroguajacolicus]
MLTAIAAARGLYQNNPKLAQDRAFALSRLAGAYYGAFISYNELAATPRGLPASRAGILAGVPFAVKDNIDAAGLPTTAGTTALRDHVALHNARVVQQLLDAGAYVVGKTNMHELGMGVTSNNGGYGPVRNPVSPQRSAGGSSGGSAAAVASGAVPFALGTDTGGSARIPASFCGIVGFRPTVGRYSTEGLVRISWTRDTIGILAGSVKDVCIIDDVLASEAALEPIEPSALRLGVPRRDFYDDLSPEVACATENALERLESAGVTLIEVEMGTPCTDSLKAGFPIVDFETERALTKHLETLTGPDRPTFETLATTAASPDVRTLLQHLLKNPEPQETYEAALEQREALRSTYRSVFFENQIHALIYPTVVTTAPIIGDETTFTHNGRQADILRTLVANATPAAVAGTPAISVPAGTTADQLHVGLTLDGAMGSDRVVLAAAATMEAILAQALAASLHDSHDAAAHIGPPC